MFPLEKSMAGDFLRMLDVFFCGEVGPYPSLGKLGNSSELKSFKLGMGYVIVLRRLSNQLEDLLQNQQMSHLFWWSCGISSGGIDRSALYCVQGFPFGSKDVYFERSVLMTRFPHKKTEIYIPFFPVEGKTPNARTLQKSKIAMEHEPF